MRGRLDSDAALGLATLVVIGAILTLGLSGALAGLLGGGTHEVKAVFADAQQLKPGNDVRVQGLAAGKVERIERNADGRSATVTMKVRDDVGKLYGDAGAVLRYKTVLGGTFYVDLERGSPTRGPLSGPIALVRTARQVELDDVVSVVRGDARQGLQRLPRTGADALADPQAPAHLLEVTAAAAPGLQKGLNPVRGQFPDRDLRDLVSQTAKTTALIQAPNGELRQVVAGAAATVQTTAGRDAELRYALHDGAAVQDEINRTAVRLDATLDLADPLVKKLDKPAGKLAPTLQQLRPTLVETDALALRAVPLLRALRPAVRSLAGTARRGLPLVRELRPSLTRLDGTILPYLSEKDPGTTKSTAVMIGGTFAGLGAGAGGQMDANGHFIRFPATVGSSPANSLPCQVYINNPDAAQIAACNDLQSSVATYFNYQPLGGTPGTTP